MHKHILTALNWFYPGLQFAGCTKRQYNLLRVQEVLEHTYLIT